MDESLFKALMLGSSFSSFLGEFLVLAATVITAVRCARRRLRPVVAWGLCGTFGGYFLLGTASKILFLTEVSVFGVAVRDLVPGRLGETAVMVLGMGLELCGLLCLAAFGTALFLFRPLAGAPSVDARPDSGR